MTKKFNENDFFKSIGFYKLALTREANQEYIEQCKQDVISSCSDCEFSYSVALYLMKMGFKVSRKAWGWKGTNVNIQIQFPDENSKMTLQYVYMNKKIIDNNGKIIEERRFPCPISDESILSDDWILVEE